MQFAGLLECKRVKVPDLPKFVLETAPRGHPHWMTRLLMSGLLILASLSLAVQHPASDAHGAEDSGGEFLLAKTAACLPSIAEKPLRTIQLARKQVAKDGGPDDAFKMPVSDHVPIPDDRTRLDAHYAHSGYDPEHILFRGRARSISPRAPPSPFSV